jgi:hypothetical protein
VEVFVVIKVLSFNRLSAFVSWAAKDRFLIGTSILRIVFGIIILYNYLMHYFQRYLLFSDVGITDYDPAIFSLYNFSASLLYFDIVYHLGILVTILFILGYRGRVVSILTFVFYFSLYQRIGYIGDGGDNLMRIILFFMMFTNNTAHFSLDRRRKKRRRFPKKTFGKLLNSTIHNYAVAACVIQLCLVYYISAFYQVMGEKWNSGTALYYISQVESYSLPLFSAISENHLYLSIILTYATIVIKLAFPLLIFNRITKIISVLAMFAFHLGILFGMGLLTFSLIMISVEFLLFTDKEYKQYYCKIRSLIKAFTGGIKNRWHQLGAKKAFSANPYTESSRSIVREKQ